MLDEILLYNAFLEGLEESGLWLQVQFLLEIEKNGGDVCVQENTSGLQVLQLLGKWFGHKVHYFVVFFYF